MGTITNVITGATHSFLGGTGDWALSNTSDFSIVDTREELLFENLGSLKLTATAAGTVDLTIPNLSPGDQTTWESRGFFWVYANVPVTAEATVTVTDGSVVDSSTAAVAVRPRKWTLISTEGAVPTDSSRVTLKMTFVFTQPGSVYITNPTIVTPNAISRNLFAAESWLRLPQYLQEADENQENPDFPLLRFLDVLTIELDALYAAWGDLRYIPPDDPSGPKTSTLDPAISNIAVLRWWAQLLGVQFYDPSTGTTSWFNLETGVDAGGDNDGIPEWFEWETVPDGGDLDSVTSWDEIEQFNPSVSGLEDSLRWQIQTAYFGLRGGTREAIIQSAKRTLSGTEYVRYVENQSHLRTTGANSSYALTPDASALDLTGDITIITYVTADDWTPASVQFLASKFDGSLSGYALRVMSDGTLNFLVGTGAALRSQSSTAPSFVDGQGYWIEAFYNNTAKTTRFRKSSDPMTTAVEDISWTTISTSSAHAGGSPIATSVAFTVGSDAYGTNYKLIGKIHKVRLINGTPTVGTIVLSTDFTHLPAGTTSFTDASGLIWTVGSAASIQEEGSLPAWTIRIQTKQSETPDNPDIGSASPTIEEIVANAIPAGFEFIHETIAG